MSVARRFVAIVDGLNHRVGRFVMYGIFAMMAVLLWSSISKTFFLPVSWTLEMAQFAMVTYYILGGAYAIQLGSNVRMDLLYGAWSPRRKALVDAFTIFFLIFYLGVLLYGGLGSLAYSLGYWGTEYVGYFVGLASGSEEIGRLERSPTSWRPYLWPIKVVMVTGLILMLLQAVSEFIKDIIRLRGGDI
ncbi:TRAP transporter small permease subunit [Oceaniglobus trochenteri]|uniref:TRAP transporter small permease subunit n=1 Tax=Oceaniglobus trochenteri TaxID=2763260 RepID=UPI001CFF91B4|nr:TRAP transporter small permease subunit [Oceaniglobus trochenteri]